MTMNGKVNMLVNRDTIIRVNGLPICNVSEIKIQASASDAFFSCDFSVNNLGFTENYSYIVRSLFQDQNKLIVDCISTSN